MKTQKNVWDWNQNKIGWTKEGNEKTKPAILLIHGFGANTNHWRHIERNLGNITTTYAIDLLGFGNSDKPKARLKGEKISKDGVVYSFDLWGEQVADFCNEVIGGEVILVGNSIGCIVALRAAQLLANNCERLILINCAQRLMDDKQLDQQPGWMRAIRPLLKTMMMQRWLSTAIFKNAARPSVIKKVLRQAYPSGRNIDEELVNLILEPTQQHGAEEAFRGFINLFDDYLAPDLMGTLTIPIHLIWGKEDPWEPLAEARKWLKQLTCIESLDVIEGAGHCPHDESPAEVQKLIEKYTTIDRC